MRIVVVGSGAAGAGAGYELAAAGAETVLVDAEFAGAATAAGAGIVCPWLSRLTDPRWHRLANAAAAGFPPLLAALARDADGFGPGEDPGYRRVGALRLLDEESADALYARVAVRASGSPAAGEVNLLDGARARELFPPLRHEGPALWVSGAARVDGRRLAAALRRGARRHGAREVTGRAELVTRGEAVRGVRVDGELLAADAVIVAAGAWASRLLEPLGVRLPVLPQRGQLAHLRVRDADTSGWPVVFPDSPHYLLAFDGGRVVAGATREDGSGFDPRVTAAGLAEVLGEALSVAPGLADATHLETRAGLRPVGPDALPLLGALPPYAGLFTVNGLGASGLTLGAHAGSLVARLALGDTPDTDLTPYDPLRAARV
ncbi:FAD-dependent oxidoreductase [Streptomyces sp. HNM0574]|uniref:NAD(P)/FAD-dependent oxidoreductase n=1 Tax=Streptomyces sp. HNM0574 TaxID=2714954 RepID=UPI00146C5FC2|nr:FAD-dependent oxidoreductase [Streptomyces sp. HNM0574]NLU69392.1 FAD-dependent oxidoreductase [Streptomyces sp. HNM0574]